MEADLGAGVQLVGPFSEHRVVVGGRQVPHLQAWQEVATPDKVWVSAGCRMLDIPADESGRIIQFIADAIAVGMGYVNHPSADREPVKQTPFPIMHRIDSVTTDADLLAQLDPDNETP